MDVTPDSTIPLRRLFHREEERRERVLGPVQQARREPVVSSESEELPVIRRSRSEKREAAPLELLEHLNLVVASRERSVLNAIDERLKLPRHFPVAAIVMVGSATMKEKLNERADTRS